MPREYPDDRDQTSARRPPPLPGSRSKSEARRRTERPAIPKKKSRRWLVPVILLCGAALVLGGIGLFFGFRMMRHEADTQYRLVVQTPYVTGKKSSVSQSTDGKFLVTAKGDETAILWSADEGKPIRTFSDSSKIQAAVLSGDGKRVVTVSASGPTIVWDATTGNKLQTFSRSTCAALSGDGSLLVTGYASGTAVLWEAASGFKVESFRGHRSRVNCVAISPDGKQIVTGTDFNMIGLSNKIDDPDYDTSILWDATNGKRIRAFEMVNHSVHSIAFGSDGKLVAIGLSKEASLWEANSGKKISNSRPLESFEQIRCYWSFFS